MKLEETLRTLRSKGTTQNRKVYARHGYPTDTYGVSWTELRKLAKSLGDDQELARGLWKTGNGDARVLAVMIADADGMSSTELDAWARQIRFYALADCFSQLVARSPLAPSKGKAWRKSKNDHVSQVGWNLVSILAVPDGELTDAELSERLEEIESTIHSAPNRTRHAMNTALCAIGGYRPALRARALEVANAIGKVEVDHGETGCKTPDATSYIGRMAARGGKGDKTSSAARGRGTKAAASGSKTATEAVRPARKA